MTDHRAELLAELGRLKELALSAATEVHIPYSFETGSAAQWAHYDAHNPTRVLHWIFRVQAVVMEHTPGQTPAILGCVVCYPQDDSWPCTTILELHGAFCGGGDG